MVSTSQKSWQKRRFAFFTFLAHLCSDNYKQWSYLDYVVLLYIAYFGAKNIMIYFFYQVQGVSTRYDILWSPRWPTENDFQIQKKVAAHSGHGDIWNLSIFFQKGIIGWPQEPLTSKLPDTSKNQVFLWSNPQKGNLIIQWKISL